MAIEYHGRTDPLTIKRTQCPLILTSRYLRVCWDGRNWEGRMGFPAFAAFARFRPPHPAPIPAHQCGTRDWPCCLCRALRQTEQHKQGCEEAQEDSACPDKITVSESCVIVMVHIWYWKYTFRIQNPGHCNWNQVPYFQSQHHQNFGGGVQLLKNSNLMISKFVNTQHMNACFVPNTEHVYWPNSVFLNPIIITRNLISIFYC